MTLDQDEIYQRLQALQDASKTRRPGTLAKKTLNLRDEIEQAFEEVGGMEYLKLLAIAKPDQFVALLKQILPQHINVNHQGTIDVVERVIVRPGELPPTSVQVEHIVDAEYKEEIEDL